MSSVLQSTKQILEKLVSFPVISGESNLDMVNYIIGYLDSHQVPFDLIYSEDKKRANIYATIGPVIEGGIMLNGHTDVVSPHGQSWSHNPFELIEHENKLYGRGCVDMKGFLACCLAYVPIWQKSALKRPIQLGFTYDEETGGYGAKKLATWLDKTNFKPSCAIIGEPTNMQIISGHKGGCEITTTVTGSEAHSSIPENGVSAIHYTIKLINFILKQAKKLEQSPPDNSIFKPAYSSINIGTINGGSSRNTIAGQCVFDWEIRQVPGDDEIEIIKAIDQYCQNELIPKMKQHFSNAHIETELKACVPGLAILPDSQCVDMVKQIMNLDQTGVVAFGTDAGYFQNIGIDSIVFGPGSINQAHKPDEYIKISDILACHNFFDKLNQHIL